MIYKAERIDLDPAKAVQISELGSASMVDLIDFLEEYVSSESNLYLSDHSFEIFSRAFQELFHSAFPEEKINSGKNRDYWKAEAINNHLKTLNERLNNGSYELQEVKIDGTSEKCFLRPLIRSIKILRSYSHKTSRYVNWHSCSSQLCHFLLI